MYLCDNNHKDHIIVGMVEKSEHHITQEVSLGKDSASVLYKHKFILIIAMLLN